jgi:hypothetical protein
MTSTYADACSKQAPACYNSHQTNPGIRWRGTDRDSRSHIFATAPANNRSGQPKKDTQPARPIRSTASDFEEGSILMKIATNTFDVKNLCSRKLWELAESHSSDLDALGAIAEELQLRRHYLNELEQLLPPLQASRH